MLRTLETSKQCAVREVRSQGYHANLTAPSSSTPCAQIKEATEAVAMLSEHRESGRQIHAWKWGEKRPVSVILGSAERRLWCYPHTEGERGRGKLEGLKDNVSGAQARRQVSTATGKRRRLPMCRCPLHPTPIYPLTPPPPPLQTSICGLTTRHRQWREGGTNRKRERTRSFGSPDILHSDSWWRQIRLTHAHNCQTSPAPHPLLPIRLLKPPPHTHTPLTPPSKKSARAFPPLFHRTSPFLFPELRQEQHSQHKLTPTHISRNTKRHFDTHFPRESEPQR